MRIFLIALGVAIALAAGFVGWLVFTFQGGEEPVIRKPDAATALTLEQGALVGSVEPNGARAWRGVPFAAPPVGDLRWRAPRPHAGWDGEREAVASGPRCPQVTNALDRGRGLGPGLLVGQEDCLTLDIYAPAEAEGAPVMVWIHGGSNVWGSAATYDGSFLAQEQGVIVVAVQYRLGPLGWFAHDAIRDDADGIDDETANFAMMDHIAALAWVSDNIVAFGGDPSRVTIFGESAGGHNVAALLATPFANGLFNRAIIQSGSLDTAPLDIATGAAPGSQFSSRLAAERMLGAGVDQSARALRDVSLGALYQAYRSEGDGGRIAMPRVIADGVSLPLDGIRGALSREGDFNAVPVITGTNRDEMRLFNMLDETLTSRVLGFQFRIQDRTLYEILSDYQGRLWRILAVDEAAGLLRSAGHEEVWAYRFDWDEGGQLVFNDTSFLLGAAHGMEIPFVFNRYSLFGPLDRALFNAANADGRAGLAAAMGGYWAGFAGEGRPVAEGQPDWERYADGRLMRFDSAEDGGPEMISGTDGRDALIEDLGADGRLDQARRCEIAARLDLFRPNAELQASARIGCAG
jgi:para-nitrobenzyl esterase